MKKFNIPLVVFVFVLLFSCQSRKNKTIETDAGFGKYVQAFTSGVISTESVISVYLAQPVIFDEKSLNSIFDFSPEIKGETVLIGDRILEFRPQEKLQSGKTYRATVFLNKVLKVEKDYEKMPFQFSTLEQNFSLTVNGLENYSSGETSLMKLSGYILTADVSDPEKTEKIISVNYGDRNLPANWNHDSDQRKHFFTIDSISRFADKSALLRLIWDGSVLGVNKKGEENIEVPPLSSFSILEATVVQQPEQHIQVRFSDPLLKTQDLTGLFELDNAVNLRFTIDGNVLNAWPENRISGEVNATVYRGIESVSYYKLQNDEHFLLQFSSLQPAVKRVGKGVIVPQKNYLEIPFEAVSLQAIDVQVIQIFKDNILSFFQENQFNGNSELKKVGRLVYSGKVDLQSAEPVNYNEWNTFKIDLAKLITIEPGAIYRVEFRFKKEYSLYNCDEAESKENDNVTETTFKKEEPYQTEWDSPGWYSDYYYPDGFRWDELDNPCHVSYYNYERFVRLNIFASELGIIAKEGKNRHFNFAVSNLLTTEPESGVEVQLYNYQNQWIETVQTDNNGLAAVDLSKKPFFLLAQKNGQFAYLRLDDGTSLSTSNFNVAGQSITEGMKGFIYGERDVWRPGDTLFLNFILETNSRMEENHPAILKLFNPQGQLVEKRVQTNNENGFYSFTTKTENDAPTGNWRAEVQVGNATFSKRIRIESIKPNRLKIELKLPENKIISNSSGSILLNSAWLHGTPAKNLKTKVEVLFTKNNSAFKGFEKFTFTDPASYFTPIEQTVYEGKLNEKGETSFDLKINNLNRVPGMLNAWFTSRVFEEGGDFSTSIIQAKYAPFKTFVGLKMPESEDKWYKTDTDYSPEIVLVDENGKATSGDNVEVKLYKIGWRWWWESGTENLANYVSGNYYKPVKTWNISQAKHNTKLKLNVKYRNWEDNGRYLLWVKDVNSGHSTGITFYMSRWGSWRAEGTADGATMLSLRTNKEKYVVGDDIEIIIPSSKTGRALVSVENGTEVKDLFWVKTNETETKFILKANADLAPNFYVHVSLIQPYGQTENDAPIRLYGITPVFVENPATILSPLIEVPEEIEPESNYSIKVSEANKQKMTYTLAVVDEGLLGITNFKTPNPHTNFYTREALGVKTWDMYDFVAGAYGARLEKAFAIGGDGEMSERGKKEANRFKPVVQFVGPFTLEKGKTQNHEFTMPNYIGAVRVMVVAGNQGAYGMTEKSVPVRKGLMLLATLPRVLAPLEEITLPVNVFALKNNVQNVRISVETNPLIELVSDNENQLQFTELGEKMSYFKLKVKENTGIGTIHIEAKSGKELASYDVEIEIRNPNSFVSVEDARVLDGNQSWQATLKAPGTNATNSAWVEVSGFPALNIAKHLDYLIRYQHGCVEQLTSAAFPQLFIENLNEIDAEQKKQMEDNVRRALQKLVSYQLPNGGFSYWPGISDANEWGSNYAGHFLLSAENAGYSLPYGLKENWLKFQKNAAKNWSSSSHKNIEYQRSDFIQAYRLYTLAKAGKADLGAMNRLRETPEKNVEVTWRLAAAYVLAGKKEVARELVNGLSKEVKMYNEFGGTFGSSLRDKAMILETLILLEQKEEAFLMLKNMAEEVNKKSWLSTQTASWTLFSAAKFSEAFYKSEAETRFELTGNGEKTKIRTKIPVVKIPLTPDKNGNVALELVNQGTNTIFVKALARGIPTGVDSSSAAENLILKVNYVDAENQPINPNELQQGTDFKLIVTVKHPGTRVNYEEMVLSTVFPSGWEILNKRISGAPQNSTLFEYQDIRDDRVYTYFDLKMNEEKTFEIRLNAAYKGKYYQPPVSCEAMYDFSVRAQQPGKWVKIK